VFDALQPLSAREADRLRFSRSRRSEEPYLSLSEPKVKAAPAHTRTFAGRRVHAGLQKDVNHGPQTFSPANWSLPRGHDGP
jgi:hypothetical protein